jgi:hypothetical protein
MYIKKMRMTKYFIAVLVFLALMSCVMDPEQYIPVHVINNTGEDLNCHDGTLFSIIYTIPKNSPYTVMVIKGVDITLTGKESRLNYGTRKFYSEGTWIVN